MTFRHVLVLGDQLTTCVGPLSRAEAASTRVLMIESDAIAAALKAGVTFRPELDARGEGIVAKLFIVHAGLGAETLHPSIHGSEIWSHS